MAILSNQTQSVGVDSFDTAALIGLDHIVSANVIKVLMPSCELRKGFLHGIYKTKDPDVICDLLERVNFEGLKLDFSLILQTPNYHVLQG